VTDWAPSSRLHQVQLWQQTRPLSRSKHLNAFIPEVDVRVTALVVCLLMLLCRTAMAAKRALCLVSDFHKQG
jgi:hypothetical protein